MGKKRYFTENELKELNKEFERTKFPTKNELIKLAEALKVDYQRVYQWFGNQRQKERSLKFNHLPKSNDKKEQKTLEIESNSTIYSKEKECQKEKTLISISSSDEPDKKLRKKRQIFSNSEIEKLKEEFNCEKYPTREKYKKLSEDLNIHRIKIVQWFKSERRRGRRDAFLNLQNSSQFEPEKKCNRKIQRKMCKKLEIRSKYDEKHIKTPDDYHIDKLRKSSILNKLSQSSFSELEKPFCQKNIELVILSDSEEPELDNHKLANLHSEACKSLLVDPLEITPSIIDSCKKQDFEVITLSDSEETNLNTEKLPNSFSETDESLKVDPIQPTSTTAPPSNQQNFITPSNPGVKKTHDTQEHLTRISQNQPMIFSHQKQSFDTPHYQPLPANIMMLPHNHQQFFYYYWPIKCKKEPNNYDWSNCESINYNWSDMSSTTGSANVEK